MVKAPLPTGKCYFKNFNQWYNGQPLEFGIYEVIIKNTPRTIKYPCLGFKDSKLIFGYMKNMKIKKTHEELLKSY